MSGTKPYVSKGALADKRRRQVRAVGTQRIGQRTVIPKAKPPRRRRPKYQAAGTLGAFAGMCTALFAATGSILWLVGSVAAGAGGCASAYLEYRRDLIEVKRTGKPIGAPQQQPAPPAKPAPAKPAGRAKKPADDHLARCKAQPPGGPTCRCPDGPNRKGKPAAKKRPVKAKP